MFVEITKSGNYVAGVSKGHWFVFREFGPDVVFEGWFEMEMVFPPSEVRYAMCQRDFEGFHTG